MDDVIMPLYGYPGVQLPIPRVANWRALYEPNARAVCVKDDPPMNGFGRSLKTGDIIDVDSVCYNNGIYELGVKSECAFYHLEDYFEVLNQEREVK